MSDDDLNVNPEIAKGAGDAFARQVAEAAQAAIDRLENEREESEEA